MYPNSRLWCRFAQGNLTEASSFSAGLGAGAQAQGQNTRFNPTFKFGPPPADTPVFRMTAFLPEVTVRRLLSCSIGLLSCSWSWDWTGLQSILLQSIIDQLQNAVNGTHINFLRLKARAG